MDNQTYENNSKFGFSCVEEVQQNSELAFYNKFKPMFCLIIQKSLILPTSFICSTSMKEKKII